MIDLRDFLAAATLDALAWTLLHFLWQGALLGTAAFAALRLLRPERAATRYVIGVTTLSAMLLACAVTFALLVRQPQPRGNVDDPSIAQPFVGTSASDIPPTAAATVIEPQSSPARAMLTQALAFHGGPLSPMTRVMVVSLWALGVFALSLRLLGGWIVTRRLANGAVTRVTPAIERAAAEIADRLGLRRIVTIAQSSAVAVPTLVGWVKPVVLVPAAALSGLTPEQLNAILAHELAHVRRHDYLVNLLQSIVETLLFYHPAIWWVSAQVRAEREHCCDDLAVEVCGDRLIYVSALAELTAMVSDHQLALAATDGSLVGRVQRILGSPRTVHEPAPAWPLLSVLVLILASIGGPSAAERTPATSTSPAAAIVNRSSVDAAAPHFGAVNNTAADNVGTTARATSDDGKAALSGMTTVEKQPVVDAALENSAESSASPQWFRGWFEPAPLASPTPAAPAAPPAPPAPPADVTFEVAAVPAAPNAPSAPPAPPAPPAASASQEMRGSGNMSWSDGNERLSVKWTGAFRLSDDERDIAWIEDGATVTITDGLLLRETVQLRGVNGTVERSYSKNGLRRDYEPEGRLFLSAAIDKLIRHSGAFAKERVARFLQRGGPDAVLAEIDRLADSSYVHRVYYTELMRQAPLTEPLLTRILQRIPADITSDYDKATLLTAIVKLPAITEAHRVAVARAVKTIGSDYDQRRTLIAVMTQPLSTALAATILEASGSITSDYDHAQVLTEVADRGGLTSATSAEFMTQLRSIGSSYDQRRVLTAVTNSGGLTDGVAVEAIKSAGAITSSHDKTETLLSLVARGSLNDASADAFFASASQIASAHDLQRVLRRVIDQPSLSGRILEGVLRAAAKVNSGHDRANVLEAVAAKTKLTGAARDLYLDAARGLGNHDENRALAALVRAEVRR